ncbi:MAG: periplasmic protein [Gallionellaceae bacterium]|nr:MAG: periplasmic protein [Gallionellaceae bacterium]
MNWPLYQRRERVAQLATATIGLLILMLSQTLSLRQEMPVREEPISLSIISDAQPELVVEQPVVQTQPPLPQMMESPQEVMPVTEAPAPVAVPTPPVMPVAKVEPQPEPQVQRSNSAAEGMFAQDVRSRIERKKIYPDAARDLGMSGEVEVLYELDRTGSLIRAEIVASSGYKLLDQAALRAVKSATYKSFPEDAWLGASSKTFRTKLVFSINQ